MIRKTVIVVLLVLLLLLVVVIGGSYYLLGTDKGFRLTAEKVQSWVPALAIDDSHGNLERGIKASSIRWQQDGMQVNVHGLESNWSSACLLKYRYCLDKLSIERLVVKIRAGNTTASNPPGPVVLPEIKLPLAIEANEVSLGLLVLDLNENAPPIEINDLKLKASMAGTKLSVDWLVASYQNYFARFNGEIKLKDNYAIRGNLRLEANDFLPGQSVQAQVGISQSLNNLDLDAVITGSVSARARVTIDALDSLLPHKASVSWDSLGWPLESATLVNTKNTTLTLDGDLNDTSFNLDTVVSGAVSGRGLPESRLSLAGLVNTERLLVPELTVLTLDGFATGSAAADWSDTVTWVADLIAKDINPGLLYPEFPGQLNALVQANGTAANGQWDINIKRAQADGVLRGLPIKLDAKASKNRQDRWLLQALALEHGPNSLGLTGSYGKQLDVQADIVFPAIHHLVPGIAGNLNAKASITGDPLSPNLQVQADSTLLKAGAVLLRGLDLDATIGEAGISDSAVKLSVGKVDSSGQQLRNTRLNLKGKRTEHTASLFFDGPDNTALSVTVDGHLSEEYAWRGTVKKSGIELPAHPLTLVSSIPLVWKQAEKLMIVGAHCWQHVEARLCLDNPIAAAPEGNASVSLVNYSLSNLNPFLPASAQLAGEASGSGKLRWDADSEQLFEANVQSRIDNGVITVTDENENRHQFEYQALKLDTLADAKTVNASLVLESRAMGNGRLSVTLNPHNQEQSIAGDVVLRGFNIGFIQAFMPELDTVGGNLNIRGTLGGNIAQPDFTGRVTLLDTVLKSADLPLSIDGGKITADVGGEKARLGGRLQSGEGAIDVSGDVRWQNKSPSASILLQGESLSIVQKPLTRSSVSPKLRIRFKPGNLSVSGKIDVASAAIDIKELPEGSATLSDDVVIIEDEITEQANGREQSGPALALAVDVDIALGDEVNLSGYGIEAKLAGDFSLKMANADPPQLNGEILVTEGFYKSYGQDLSITDGQILFVGPVERTTLDIDAVREIDNEERVAGLHLEGPIADPQVTLFTTPADKSQESILSYIVLGRDIGGGNNASEEQMLTAAALALTLKGGQGFATNVAESLGIEDFTLEAEGSGDDTQVVASGRLNDRLLLRYGRNIFEGQQSLYLRYDLSRKLYLEAAKGAQAAVDLFYSFSF